MYVRSLESSSTWPRRRSCSCCGVGGDTTSHEFVDGDCDVRPIGGAGEVEELGASRQSASEIGIPRRGTTGVEGGTEDEVGRLGCQFPGLVSVHFCAFGGGAELELGCSCAVCCAVAGLTEKHFAHRVLVMPLRQCRSQKCLQQMSQVVVARVKHEVSEQQVYSGSEVLCAGDFAVSGVDMLKTCGAHRFSWLEVGVDAVGAELGASHDEVNTPSAIWPPAASTSPMVSQL